MSARHPRPVGKPGEGKQSREQRDFTALDHIQQFRSAIAAAGFNPPETIEADGGLHRFASNGKRGDLAGWYVLHGDGIPAGEFGCWRSGIRQTWHADIGRTLTDAEREQQRRRMAAVKRERERADRTRCSRIDHERKALAQAQISTCSILRDWIKGQITAVEVGLLTFEGAFLGQILLPNGSTVLEAAQQGNLLPQLEGPK